jgi:hypothetical protein
MNDAPFASPGLPSLAKPREAILNFVGDVCTDLESKRNRLGAVQSVDQLISVATDTHKALVDHGHTMRQFLQFVQDWQTGRNP